MWLMNEIILWAGSSLRTAVGPEPHREEPGTGLRSETGGGGCWVTGQGGQGFKEKREDPEGRKKD